MLDDTAIDSIASVIRSQQGLETFNFSENTLSKLQFSSLMNVVREHPELRLLDVTFSTKPSFEGLVQRVLEDKVQPTLSIKTLP